MEDTRCCGTGACIIDAQGHCWCGQKWDGKRMRGRVRDEPIASEATQPSQEEPAMGSTPSAAPSTDR